MINIKFKPESIKKVVKTFQKSIHVKKHITTKKNHLLSPVRLSDVLVNAICPSLAQTLVERGKGMKEKEAALEREKIKLQTEKTKFDAAKVAEAKKQAAIKQGTAAMFRDNRIHSQRELVRQQRAADALEMALCDVAQDELDKTKSERDQETMALLAAAATQNAIASMALEAKAKAEDMSARLAKAIEASQSELLNLQLLRSGVEARYKSLGELLSSATAKQAKAHDYLRKGMDQCIRFEALIQDVEKRMCELDALLSAEAAAEKEKDETLRDAKLETQRRMDARAEFEKLRDEEKVSMANKNAQVDDLLVKLEKEKRDVKAEKERVRLLIVEAEVERAAAVDAKLAALEELRQAVTIRMKSNQASLIAKQEAMEDLKAAGLMRLGSKWAIDRLVVIAGEMTNITGDGADTAETMKEEHGPAGTIHDNGKDKDGRMSRMEVYRDGHLSGIPGSQSTSSKDDTHKLEGINENIEGKSKSKSVRGIRFSEVFSPKNGGFAKMPMVKYSAKSSVIGDENTPPSTAQSLGPRANGLKIQERGNRGIKELDTNSRGTIAY